MRGSRRWTGYAALNRPLTVLGVERRLFLLGATLAAAVWNATASLAAGGAVFAACHGAGWLAGRRDPALLATLRAAMRHPSRYDPGKWVAEPWRLRIRADS